MEKKMLEGLLEALKEQRKFRNRLNEQIRNLMLRSGVVTEEQLPLKMSEGESKEGIAIFEKAGFDIDIVEIEDPEVGLGEDRIFVLTKLNAGKCEDCPNNTGCEADGHKEPISMFMELHMDDKHAVTTIMDVIDGDIEKTLDAFFAE